MSSSRWPNISHGSILCIQLLLNLKPINQIMDFSIVNLQFSSDFLLLKLLIHRSCGKLLCFIFIFTFGSVENITAYIWTAVKLSSFSWLHKKSKKKKRKKSWDQWMGKMQEVMESHGSFFTGWLIPCNSRVDQEYTTLLPLLQYWIVNLWIVINRIKWQEYYSKILDHTKI